LTFADLARDEKETSAVASLRASRCVLLCKYIKNWAASSELVTLKKCPEKTYLDESHPEDLKKGEWTWVTIRAGGPAHAPISIRLSAPLLKELDRLAKNDRRPRSSLIRHVLWEYVLTQRKTRPPSKRKAR
jgi:hypothetical protein